MNESVTSVVCRSWSEGKPCLWENHRIDVIFWKSEELFSRVLPMSLIGLLMIVVLGASLTGCSSGQSTSEIRPGYGEFQEIRPGLNEDDIPFDFVFPAHLPEGIDKRPVLTHLYPEPGMEDTADVTVAYISTENKPDAVIDVFETNYPNMRLPDGPEYVYFELSGVDIVESRISMDVYYPDGTDGFVRGLVFRWIQESIYFQISLFGYERDEAIKVVESMIMQQT